MNCERSENCSSNILLNLDPETRNLIGSLEKRVAKLEQENRLIQQKLQEQEGANEYMRYRCESWTSRCILEKAAEDNNLPLLKHCIEVLNLNLDPEYSKPPLYIAAKKGHKEAVKYLLEQGANVNCTYRNNKLTPFYAAYNHVHIECLDLLLQYAANIDLRYCNQETILHISANSISVGSKNALNWLKSKNTSINVNALNKAGYSPLHVACKIGNTYAVKILLGMGADPELPTDEFWSKKPIELVDPTKNKEIIEIFEKLKTNRGLKEIEEHKDAL